MDTIISLGVNALKQAYSVQKKLLDEETISDLVSVGRGEDRATKGDWESEEAVIKHLTDNNFPGRIISEEHGQIDLGEDYLAILDGIDGSSALVKNPNSRCGTILTISDKLEPTYNDFIFSGMTEFINNRIVYGIKGKGVYLIENLGKNEREKKLSEFVNRNFSKDNVIKIDCYKVDYAPGITKGMIQFEEFIAKNVSSKLERKMKLAGSITGSEMSFDLLEGKVDAVAHIVAKGVFEPPAFYLLTRELKGYGTDLQGIDLRNKKWMPVGMNVNAVIFASSKEISDKVIGYLNE